MGQEQSFKEFMTTNVRAKGLESLNPVIEDDRDLLKTCVRTRLVGQHLLPDMRITSRLRLLLS